MNIRKTIKSIFSRKRQLVLLTALLVSATVSTQNPILVQGMMGDGPIDVEPIDREPPPFQAPADGFTWNVPRRFGTNVTGDAMIDYHWDSVSMTYDPNYIFPESWPAQFIGCQTEADANFAYNNTPNTYTWTIVGVSTTTVHQCVITLNFPDQGDYTVQMEVRDPSGNVVPAGRDPAYFEQQVTIKDYFIVSIGDSLASGEGNPDIEMWATANIPPFGWTERRPAVWQDKRCHRSAKTGAAMAALALEGADPHTSVTFISFACSGATINTPMFDGGDAAKHLGTGILGPYRGAESDVPYSDTFVDYIPGQMDQLRTALADRPAGRPERRIDALTISAGGNDIHFGDIASKCVADNACWTNSRVKEDPHSNTEYGLYELVARALKTNFVNGEPSNSPTNVPDGFESLASEINDLSPAPPAHIYLTQYMDQTRDDNGNACIMLEDIVWWYPDRAIYPSESEIASWFATRGLNDVLLQVSKDYKDQNWQFVDGISSYEVQPGIEPGTPGLFVGPPGGPGHGYCASDNWIRRADESEIIQGPVNSRDKTRGTLHPNYRGHEVYKERILHYMLPDLLDLVPEQAPTFSSSFSSAGLTNQPGENGWYIQSCDGQDVCFPKVVVQAVAVSNTAMNGASILVNGERGCNGSSVICETTPSPDAKQLTYAVEINASGIYRFQFNAQDTNGRVSFLQQEIKVDLEDPVLATPIGPFEVDEGSSVELSASIATDADGVPLYEDVLVDYDWDLDNDGIFETTDEQPTFSAEELSGPASQTIQVQVTDRAGRTATAQAAVNVLNVAPDPVINGAPESSNEGTAINLTSTVIGAAPGDIYTYAWVVKKNGSSFASGTNADFSFTPDDNGSYEVSLDVTDDDGDVGTATSQTIAVTNVAPALSNLSVPSTGVNEGASFTLSGDITEPGTADTLALTIDWGDGSAELLSLPAGSTSFSRSHTYADDNPTGTASDTYSIALSIADDDGGTGTGSVSMVVNNLAPSLTISAPESGSLYAVNATVSLNASLTDPSSLDTLTCSVNWDDGTTGSGTLTAGACTTSHVYTAAGVYTIRMTGADDDMGVATESVMVVVYDPSAGFVTGGGWIDSPVGAYKVDEGLTGKATFGFVSKYQKGASIPTGNTAFEFDLAGLDFSSTSYEWLVVNQAATNAQFKGTGLINGIADPNGNAYKFMLWAGDGSPDTFRIRIWWEDAAGEQVVYDNGVDQTIGAGNIVVHTRK